MNVQIIVSGTWFKLLFIFKQADKRDQENRGPESDAAPMSGGPTNEGKLRSGISSLLQWASKDQLQSSKYGSPLLKSSYLTYGQAKKLMNRI